MNRRAFLASSVAAGAAFLRDAHAAPAAKPNIVYVLCDDLGWGDLSCYNPESRVPMPNANRLAREGVRFTDMHSPSAVCSPTRYGILTGRYCWRTEALKKGVLWGYSPSLIEKGRLTVPLLLKQAGYATAGFGKWHLGLGSDAKTDYTKPLRPGPLDFGFDTYFGIPASLDMEPYVFIEDDHVVEQPTSTTPGQNDPRGVFWRPGPIAPSLKIDQVLPAIQNKAVAWLRSPARSSKPFFLYLALSSPHTPWMPSPEFRGKSGAGLYGDFAAQTDAALGAVLKALDETGQAGNTLVIFTSDNGAHWTPDDKRRFPQHRANANWRGMKADIHEAGHRIPFLVRWPGKAKAGHVDSQTACLTDLMATVAQIVGTPLPDHAGEDSFSFLPALTGGKISREAVVHHSSEGMFAIRQGDWKLCAGLGSGGFSEPKTEAGAGGQLYNIRQDPGETNNLYAQRPDVVHQLTTLLQKYRDQGRSRPLRGR